MGVKKNFLQALDEIVGNNLKDENKEDLSVEQGNPETNQLDSQSNTGFYRETTQLSTPNQNSNSTKDEFFNTLDHIVGDSDSRKNYQNMEDPYDFNSNHDMNYDSAKYDDHGNYQVYIDDDGNERLIDKDGFEIFVDEEGYERHIDSEGIERFTDHDGIERFIDSEGYEVYRDANGYRRYDDQELTNDSTYNDSENNNYNQENYSLAEPYVPETTVISEDTRIIGTISSASNVDFKGVMIGDIEGQGIVQVSGAIHGDVNGEEVNLSTAKIIGNIESKTYVNVDDAALVRGNISADVIELNGKIKGSLFANLAKLSKGSLMVGDITANEVNIEQGARIKGQVNIDCEIQANELDIRIE